MYHVIMILSCRPAMKLQIGVVIGLVIVIGVVIGSNRVVIGLTK